MAKRGNRFYALILFELTEGEQKRLLDFMASPYCTGLPADNPNLRLVKYTLDLGNQEAAEATEEAIYFSSVCPEQIFTPDKFNHLVSDTNKLVRKFILSEMAHKDEREEALVMLRFYEGKKLDKKFWSEADGLKDWQSNRKGWKIQEYFLNFQIEFATSYSRSRNNDKKDDLGLSKTIAALDEYYLLMRISLALQLLNQSRLTKLHLSDAEKAFPLEISGPPFSPFFTNPLVRLFWSSMTLLRGEIEDEQSVFEAFYNDLYQEEAEVYLDDFEKYACNFLIGQIDAGEDQYLEQLFSLQKQRVESRRVFGQDGKILKGEFQSIVAVALKNGQLQWASNFIAECGDKIGGTEYPQDCCRYNLANYYFYSRDFEKALDHLEENQNAYQDQQYRVSAKFLEIKIFYETNDMRRLKPHLDSFKMFFSREKKESKDENDEKGKKKSLPIVPDNKRVMGKNFVNIMYRLVRVTEKTDRVQIEKIAVDVDEIEWLAERAWLKQKINLLTG